MKSQNVERLRVLYEESRTIYVGSAFSKSRDHLFILLFRRVIVINRAFVNVCCASAIKTQKRTKGAEGGVSGRGVGQWQRNYMVRTDYYLFIIIAINL